MSAKQKHAFDAAADDLSRQDALRILLMERDYHNSHPQDVNRKAAFTVVSFVTGFLLLQMKGAVTGPEAGLTTLGFASIGLVIAAYGLRQHTKSHHRHRDALVEVINELLSAKGKRDFSSFLAKRPDGFVPLRIEPDPIGHDDCNHDCFIFGGVGVMVFGVLLGIFMSA